MYHEYELTRHKVDGAATGNTVMVTDKPGRANANHAYKITGFNTETNPNQKLFAPPVDELEVLFQNGPVDVNGRNGVTIEELLVICQHRLTGFQGGPASCDDNEEALEGITKALEALKRRTKKRLAQGVEGTKHKHN